MITETIPCLNQKCKEKIENVQFRRDYKELEDKYNEVQNKLEDLQHVLEKEDKKEEISKLVITNIKLEREKLILSERIKYLQDRILSLESAVIELKKQCGEQIKELNEIQNKYELDEEIQKRLIEKKKLEKELNQLNRDRLKFKEFNDEMKLKLPEMIKQHNELVKQIKGKTMIKARIEKFIRKNKINKKKKLKPINFKFWKK